MKHRAAFSGSREFPHHLKRIIKGSYRRFGFPVRGLLMALILAYEGGEYWSPTLREIFWEVYGIEIGTGTYGCFRPDAIPRGTVFGNYCSVATNVRFIGSNHPVGFASTHPMFYHASFGYVEKEQITRSNTIVGHDVWLGYNSLVLSGCHSIGTGAAVAAGSVVTKDVEPYSIVAGVPAKILRKRFSDEIAGRLLASEWYRLKPNALGALVREVQDPERFLDAVENLAAQGKNHA